VADIHTENHRLSARDMVKVRFNNQPISTWDEYRFLDVSPIVLHFVEADLGEVYVCLDTNAPDRNQFTAFHGFAEAKPMSRVAKNL
jgi:hypothetical protein